MCRPNREGAYQKGTFPRPHVSLSGVNVRVEDVLAELLLVEEESRIERATSEPKIVRSLRKERGTS